MSAVLLVDTYVPGRPRTKGSLDERHQDSQQSKQWRGLVAKWAGDDFRTRRAALKRGDADIEPFRPFTTPILVAMRFDYVDADVTKITIGDLDKLARNVLDALSPPTKHGPGASVYADDSQVVLMPTMKAGSATRQGVKLLVWSIDEFLAAYLRQKMMEAVIVGIERFGALPA